MARKQSFVVEPTIITEDLGWDELVAELVVMEEMAPGAEIGFPEGRGLESRKAGERVSVLARATTNEFGSRALNIPKRPFLRRAFDTGVARWVAELDRAASVAPSAGGGPPMAQAFARVVEDAVKHTKSTIEGWDSPANAPATVARKGFNDPLVETGLMMAAVQAALVYTKLPAGGVPQGLKERPTKTQRGGKGGGRGRRGKGLLGALRGSARRWQGLGAERAFLAPGKSASKKATRTRFVPRVKYTRPRV